MRTGSSLETRLGRVNALAVSKRVGGCRLTIPECLDDAPGLKRRLGDKLATLLVLHFGGRQIYIPRIAFSKPISVEIVDRLTQRGWKADKIARHLGCSNRTVFTMRAKAAKARRKTDDE